jgi:hypothetical protein
LPSDLKIYFAKWKGLYRLANNKKKSKYKETFIKYWARLAEPWE